MGEGFGDGFGGGEELAGVCRLARGVLARRVCAFVEVEQLDSRVEALLPRFDRLVPKPMLHEQLDKLRAELEKDKEELRLDAVANDERLAALSREAAERNRLQH